MLIIDAQVHCYERDHPGRPWHKRIPGMPEVTGDDMVKAMDAVGVDGALLVSPWSLYRWDASYALAVRDAYPSRFALVMPVNPDDPKVAERVAEWARRGGVVGIRILMLPTVPDEEAEPDIDRVLAAAAKYGMPVSVMCPDRLEQIGRLAARHPDTQLVIDHMGLHQPHSPPPPPLPWVNLPDLLRLAPHKNVAVKITGACTLSHERFPYQDIWDPLVRIFDALGLERCMWGTDWTRAVELLTYREGVESFRLCDRLSDSDRATLMGGTAQRVYGWSPSLPDCELADASRQCQSGNNARPASRT